MLETNARISRKCNTTKQTPGSKHPEGAEFSALVWLCEMFRFFFFVRGLLYAYAYAVCGTSTRTHGVPYLFMTNWVAGTNSLGINMTIHQKPFEIRPSYEIIHQLPPTCILIRGSFSIVFCKNPFFIKIPKLSGPKNKKGVRLRMNCWNEQFLRDMPWTPRVRGFSFGRGGGMSENSFLLGERRKFFPILPH